MRNWEEFVRSHLSLPELSPQREARIVRELAAQLEDFYHEALARGLSEAEADAFARRQVRDWRGLAAEVRAADQPNVKTFVERLEEKAAATAVARGGRWSVFANFTQDFRYATRHLRRAPGFALVAVLTLALGIGANTTIFSIINSLLLNPLPYRDAGRIVFLWKQQPKLPFMLSTISQEDLELEDYWGKR